MSSAGVDMRRSAWSLVVAVGLATAGCAEVVGSEPVEPVVDDHALEGDLQEALNVVNGFWGVHFTEFFGTPYRPPEVLGSYDENSLPTCAGRQLEPLNAFYCVPEDYLTWDIDLMRAGYAVGDAWVDVVIAHEWGHAIQARLGNRGTSVALELQADCLAAVALYGAAADGALRFEPGDLKEIVAALNVFGDETPWTNPRDHGDSLERIDAFKTGRDDGIRACLPR